jgi:mannosyltransferase
MEPNAASDNRSERYWLAAALLVSLAAAILRIWPVRESLWIDELHTAWCAAGALDEVASRAALGNQSPLYFWFQWLLVRVLGPSELSLRLPSLIAGSLLPLAVFFVGQRWFSAAAGLLGAALVAIDPLAIFYASEARPYALVQVLAVVHFALTAEILTKPATALRVAWVVIGGLLFHLHYTAALLFPAELLFYGLMVVLQPRLVLYRWTSALCDGAILVVVCLPAVGVLNAIYARRANWDAFVELVPYSTIVTWWLTALGAWYVAAGIATSKRDDGGRVAPAVLLLCWLIVPTLLAWIFAQSGVARLFFGRYLIACAPAAALLAAISVELAPWRWAKVTVGALLFVAVLWSSSIVSHVYHEGRVIAARGEDWRGCITWLNEEAQQSQFPVLVWSGLIEADALRQPHDELFVEYSLFPVNSMYPLDAEPADVFPLPLKQPGRLEQVVEMLMVHRGSAWLVVRGDRQTGKSIAESIIANLDKSSIQVGGGKWQILNQESFGSVQAIRLAVGLPNGR